MQPDSNPSPRPGCNDGFHAELLNAGTPGAVVAVLAGALPGQTLSALWSSRWPQAIASDPPDAGDHELARAVREVSARRAGGRPHPRYAVLCDDPDAGVAVLRLDAALPTTAAWRQRYAAAGKRMAEVLTLERLRGTVTQLEDAERLQRALYAIADMASSDLDMPDMLRGLHRIVSELMYAENFYIVLHDAERDCLQFPYFVDTVDALGPAHGEEIPLARIEHGVTWYLMRNGHPMMGTTDQLREQVPGPLVLHGADSCDWLGVPMLRDGRVIGALVVQSYLETVRYTRADMSLLAFVAEHVQTALERKTSQALMERQVRERTGQLAQANDDLSREVAERQRGERLQAALYRIAALAGSDETSAVFYRHVHSIVGELINARNFYIALLADDGARVEFPYAVDELQADWDSRPFGRGLTEYVLRTQRPLASDRAQVDALVAQGEIDPEYVNSPVTSWLGAPLLGVDGAIGVVAVRSYAQDAGYDAQDAELLTFVSSQIASSLQRRKAAAALKQANVLLEERVERRTRELRDQIAQRELIEAQLKHQVMHDPLTGLPNRLYLRDRLERAIAGLQRDPQRRFALLYLDVDHFKVINDSLGHLAGDAVLKEVARRLGECVREPDVVARLSGDEFAILLQDAPVPQTAIRVAQRILDTLRQPMTVAGRELQNSASIGIAIGGGRQQNADALLHDADVALYRAKSGGRHRFVLFDDSLQREAMDVLGLEQELRTALAEEQFEPYFQPLVRLADGGRVGYEALVRWHHPQHGVQAPGEFLPVAEERGMLEAIDWQLYGKACSAGVGLLDGDAFITINVSPRHFQDEGFEARLLQLASDSGLAPAQLRIEITEGTLLGDPDAVAGALHRLREAGIESALDDFGTGYSSLGNVHRFPLTMLKIDRSFVAPLGSEQASRSAAVIGAVLALGRVLGLDVVAEGIETPAQRDALLALGCVYGQGYLFGHPQPAAHWRQHG